MKKGKQNEIDILTAVTGKRVKELNEKWKKHINRMFPEAKDDDMIHGYFYHDEHAKPDVVISINQRSIFLSIKSGRNPSCHHESFSEFAGFLRKYGVNNRIIRIISFYQFGMSDKLSNHGEPFSREQIQSDFKPYVKEVNDFFLSHPAIVKKIVFRSLIRGVRYAANPIDFFYYGNVERGFLLSVEDIYREILEDSYVESRAIHFYGLVFQPDGRREDRQNHLFVRIKWPILAMRFYDDAFLEKYS